jgi:hypothetical protein
MSRDHLADKQRLIGQLSKTPIVEVACKKVNLPRSTYYRWRKDIDFAEACDAAIEESIGLINDMAESQLISAIKDGNMTGIALWLRHRHPGFRARVELSGSITHKAELLTPEEQEIVRKALELTKLLPRGQEKTDDAG